ncbi:hypothetical protein [Chryseobacterium sp. SIMBA_028]|uniref:hypothetical protein n=1 Tax=Chryseobacterium sp. SIMBA_028 TaxID=3085771 RepID=UPI00397A37A6
MRKIEGKIGEGEKLIAFPIISNLSGERDYSVHQNTASCVLRHSKQLAPQGA